MQKKTKKKTNSTAKNGFSTKEERETLCKEFMYLYNTQLRNASNEDCNPLVKQFFYEHPNTYERLCYAIERKQGNALGSNPLSYFLMLVMMFMFGFGFGFRFDEISMHLVIPSAIILACLILQIIKKSSAKNMQGALDLLYDFKLIQNNNSILEKEQKDSVYKEFMSLYVTQIKDTDDKSKHTIIKEFIENHPNMLELLIHTVREKRKLFSGDMGISIVIIISTIIITLWRYFDGTPIPTSKIISIGILALAILLLELRSKLKFNKFNNALNMLIDFKLSTLTKSKD